MKRIAAIVINSVSHDARVLKQADSLARAGYKVTVFGIQDNRANEALSIRESGVRIVRIDWKPAARRAAKRLALTIGSAAIIVAAVLYVTQFERMYQITSTRPFAHIVAFGLIGMMSLPVWWSLRRIRRRAMLDAGAPVKSPARMGFNPRGLVMQKVKSMFMRRTIKRTFLEALRQFKPDAVHSHDLNAVPTGYAHKKIARCSLVFDSHELYEEQSLASPIQKRVYRRRQRYYSGKVDAFITINQSIADYLVRRYPRLPSPVIVKNATPLSAREPFDDGRLHKAAGLPSDRKILLYQGGFAQFRGLDVLVRSAALLSPDWCLVMMGWGKHELRLRAIAKEIDPSRQKVRFIREAPQRELAQWTAGAALGVIPYENVCLNHWFCTPNKLWEYPVAGVPILVSPFPELTAAVTTHGIGRLLSDPVTPENIAETVDSISDAELSRMRDNCRTYIGKENWAVYERRLIELYDRLLGVERKDAALVATASVAEIKAFPGEPALTPAAS